MSAPFLSNDVAKECLNECGEMFFTKALCSILCSIIFRTDLSPSGLNFEFINNGLSGELLMFFESSVSFLKVRY